MDHVVTYISALFTVYIIVIFLRIVLSFAPRPPIDGPLRAVWNFAHQSTDWYLNIFRRLIPPVGMFDLSPILALLVLYILRGLILTLLSGF
ncbi:MAG TPA: YggT family protein [Miltoncostaeaceae bacterium]|nr:YggT family protein [Miltoncostaeaceae bacterium]